MEPPIAAYNNHYWGDSYAFNISHIEEHTTLHVPEGSIEAYKTTSPWSKFRNIVALTEDEIDGIKEIESLTPALSNGEGDWYDLNGRMINSLPTGRSGGGHINIIRYSDGTSRKVLLK